MKSSELLFIVQNVSKNNSLNAIFNHSFITLKYRKNINRFLITFLKRQKIVYQIKRKCINSLYYKRKENINLTVAMDTTKK